jgi:hypothetical protein
MAKPRITTRKQKNEQGLARVCQAPRGYEFFYDKKRIGGIYAAYEKGWGPPYIFYFNIELPNGKIYRSLDTAQVWKNKDEALEFAKKWIEENK